jgi:hypothetical protein
MDAEGQVYTDLLKPFVLGGDGVVGAIAVNELLLTSVYNDTVRDGTSRRGYALSSGEAPAPLSSPKIPTTTDIRAKNLYSGNAAFSVFTPGDTGNCCGNASLVITLAHQMFFTVRVDTEKVPALQLFSSIIGLTGVLAFFSKMLFFTDVFENVVKPAVSERLKQRQPVSSSHTTMEAQQPESEHAEAHQAAASAEAKAGAFAAATTGVAVGSTLAVLSA